MLDAKIKGEGVRPEAAPALAGSNVIDLMALRKSLGEKAVTAPAVPAAKPTTKRV